MTEAIACRRVGTQPAGTEASTFPSPNEARISAGEEGASERQREKIDTTRPAALVPTRIAMGLPLTLSSEVGPSNVTRRLNFTEETGIAGQADQDWRRLGPVRPDEITVIP